MHVPLQGVTVLSLEQAVAAPYCSARLADAGARVIKVERAEGDFARGYDQAASGLSSYFVWLNRGKESLTADIKNPDDVELLHAILARADIFIQNLAPGAAARAGFDSASLIAKFPALITVDISGYGAEGPYSTMKSYDLLVQAESGLASITGHPAGPGRVGVSICDIACGMTAHAAVLQALIERGQTGKGRSLRLSLFDSIADWMNVPLLQYEASGRQPERVGLAHPTICPYGAFATQDGQQILIAVQNEREWQRFCTQVLEQPSLPTQPGFTSNVDRVKHRAAVDGLIQDALSRLPHATALQRLQAADTAYGSVNDIERLSRHPSLRRQPVQTPGGPVSIASPAGRTPNEPLGRVPSLGEHSEAIRQEFNS